MIEQEVRIESLASNIQAVQITRRELLEALFVIPIINAEKIPTKIQQLGRILSDLCTLFAVNSPYSQSPLPSLDQLRHQSIENQAVNSQLEKDLSKLRD